MAAARQHHTRALRLACALLAITCLLLLPAGVLANCECGYEALVDGQPHLFTDLLETDFLHLTNVTENSIWQPQTFNLTAERARGKYGEMYAPGHVLANPAKSNSGGGNSPDSGGKAGSEQVGQDGTPAGLQLRVGTVSNDGLVPTAELDSGRQDIFYGSFRAGIRITNVPGTCSAFFWYFNDTQEIDMEFLSKDFDSNAGIFPVNLVLQSPESARQGYDARATGNFALVNLPFDPTAATHEYRIDFTPNQVLFLADGEIIARMNGTAVPSTAGHLILQHWSNGNQGWSAGPPTIEAITTVSYVKAYFNSSDSKRHADWEGRCPDVKVEGAVCRVPDVTKTDRSAAGFFFSEQGNMTNNQTGSGKKDNEGGRVAPWVWSAGGGLLLVGCLFTMW